MCDNHNTDMQDEMNTVDDQSDLSQQEALEQELQECLLAQQEWKDKFARVTADFENFKRRSAREQVAWLESSQQKIFLELLSVVDDFDRALQPTAADNNQDSAKVWIDGFVLIRAALQKFLHNNGVEQMTNVETFDPMYHEAIAQIQVAGKPEGAIIDVLQNGYTWKNKVLRPAKVAVAQ